MFFTLSFTRKQLFSDHVGPVVALVVAIGLPFLNGIVSLGIINFLKLPTIEPWMAFASGIPWLIMCDIGLMCSYGDEEKWVQRTWKQLFEGINNLRYHSWRFWLSLSIIGGTACAISTFLAVAMMLEPNGLAGMAILLPAMIWAFGSMVFLVPPRYLPTTSLIS